MGDRTWLQATFFDCPTDEAKAVLDVLSEYNVDLSEDANQSEDHLGLGVTYSNSEILCGSAQEIANRLQTDAPNAAWELWEDPQYEWLGDIWRYTPDLGAWRADCSSQGSPVFDDQYIRSLHMRTNHPLTLTELDTLLGFDHSSTLESLLRANGKTTVDPDGAADPGDVDDLLDAWRTTR